MSLFFFNLCICLYLIWSIDSQLHLPYGGYLFSCLFFFVFWYYLIAFFFFSFGRVRFDVDFRSVIFIYIFSWSLAFIDYQGAFFLWTKFLVQLLVLSLVSVYANGWEREKGELVIMHVFIIFSMGTYILSHTILFIEVFICVFCLYFLYFLYFLFQSASAARRQPDKEEKTKWRVYKVYIYTYNHKLS